MLKVMEWLTWCFAAFRKWILTTAWWYNYYKYLITDNLSLLAHDISQLFWYTKCMIFLFAAIPAYCFEWRKYNVSWVTESVIFSGSVLLKLSHRLWTSFELLLSNCLLLSLLFCIISVFLGYQWLTVCMASWLQIFLLLSRQFSSSFSLRFLQAIFPWFEQCKCRFLY